MNGNGDSRSEGARDMFKKEVYTKLSKLDKIHDVLVGDEYGNKGIVNQVKENTDTIQDINDDRKVIKKIIGIGGTGGGGIIGWLGIDKVMEWFQ